MLTFHEYVLKKQDEGILGAIGGAVKGAWQGMKQGWSGQQPQQQNNQQSPDAQTDLMNFGKAIQSTGGRALTDVIANIKDPKAKETATQNWVKFAQSLNYMLPNQQGQQ